MTRKYQPIRQPVDKGCVPEGRFYAAAGPRNISFRAPVTFESAHSGLHLRLSFSSKRKEPVSALPEPHTPTRCLMHPILLFHVVGPQRPAFWGMSCPSVTAGNVAAGKAESPFRRSEYFFSLPIFIIIRLKNGGKLT